MPTLDSSRQYFAAKKRSDIGKALVEKLERISSDDSGAPVRDEYANAYEHLYGFDSGMGLTSGVTRGGEQNEKAVFRTNRASAYGNAFEAMALGAKLTWRPIARNGDAGASKATTLALNLLEDEWKTQRLSYFVRQWGVQAFRFSEAWMFPEWNPAKGPVVSMKVDEYTGEQRPVFGGDITYHNILPWHVFRDTTARKHEDNTWRAFRVAKNRYDLMALYPRLSTTGEWTADKIFESAKMGLTGGASFDASSDFVWVYFFFHDKTPALPFGRQVILTGPECVLADSALKYPEAPAYRIAAAELYDTPYAWTPWWDSLGIQELSDAIESDVATNISNHAETIIVRQKGSEVTAASVAGRRFMDVPANGMVPQALSLLQMPPEVMGWLKDKAGDQRQLLGLNDVALGQPQTAQMNAEAFGILVSMAVQQASPFQSAYVDAVSALGGGVLKQKAAFVTRERKLQIIGITSKNVCSEERYSGNDLAAVEKVIVEIGNPMEQTPAGRAMILQQMMNVPGAITSPEQIQQVIETGRLEPATRGQRNELQLINAEYEQLTQGQSPPVHYGQNHPLHFRNNMAALHSAEALSNPAVLAAVEAHCDEHYALQFGIDRQVDPLRFVRERWMMGHPLSPDQQAAMMAPPMPPGMMGPGDAGAPPGAAPPVAPLPPPGLEGMPAPVDGAPAANSPIPPPPNLVAL